jgi:outer capsid spike VP4 protein, putative
MNEQILLDNQSIQELAFAEKLKQFKAKTGASNEQFNRLMKSSETFKTSFTQKMAEFAVGLIDTLKQESII